MSSSAVLFSILDTGFPHFAQTAGGASQRDGPPDELLRIGRKMRGEASVRRELPHVARSGFDSEMLTISPRVIVVGVVHRKVDDVFVSICEAILSGLGHAGGFRPDNTVSAKPTISNGGLLDHARNVQQGLLVVAITDVKEE